MDIKDFKKFNDEKLAEIPLNVLDKAVNHFKQILSQGEKDEMLEDYQEAGVEWFTPNHFGYGMYLRNELRKIGLTDDLLPDQNWDDYYIPVLEVALGIR